MITDSSSQLIGSSEIKLIISSKILFLRIRIMFRTGLGLLSFNGNGWAVHDWYSDDGDGHYVIIIIK